MIDTATEALSVALFDGAECLAHHHELLGRGHAERLMPAIAALPEGGRADEILVDVGPGSFTGVRVGLAAARALAFAWNVPLRGYASLALLAFIARQQHESAGPITIAITGGHGELFWQEFAAQDLAPLTSPASTPVDQLSAMACRRIYGSGAQAWVAAQGTGEAVPLTPDARFAPQLPPHLWTDGPQALYGRSADALTLAQRAQTKAGGGA